MNKRRVIISCINTPLLIIALLSCLLHGMVYSLTGWHGIISKDIKSAELVVELITLSEQPTSLTQLSVFKLVAPLVHPIIEKTPIKKAIKKIKSTVPQLDYKSKSSDLMQIQLKGDALYKLSAADQESINNAQMDPNPMALSTSAAPIMKSIKSQSPKAHNNVKPPYPLAAFRLKQEGEVILQVEVLTSGHSGEVKVFKTSGHHLLDDAAREAVKEWMFDPALENGVTVDQWVQVPITFNLFK